jgi:hypothetical protein
MPRKKKPLPDGSVTELVSIDKVAPGDVDKMLLEIADLKAKLEASEAARGDAEREAIASAQAQGMLMQGQIQEVPSGKTALVAKFKEWKHRGFKDNGDEIVKPVFEKKRVPTFFYTIDLPPCGGTDMKINGMPLYHGAMVELDIDTLRTVKDMVYRCWKHDADIHGSDENFYRQPTRPHISMRQANAR